MLECWKDANCSPANWKKNIIAVIASKRTVAGILWQCDAWHWHWHCDWLTHYLSWFASANWRWFTFQFIKAFIAIRSDQQYNWSSEEKWVYWGNASAESYTSILSRSARPKCLHYSLVKECFFCRTSMVVRRFHCRVEFLSQLKSNAMLVFLHLNSILGPNLVCFPAWQSELSGIVGN